ncbi:flagellar basal body P-ring formation chaperone FlgA [Sphingomonas sp. LaA6.9]|uniref:flagellar basal body P-ring formation chaperone FlgA n=1 Tax=Sphingomonas sp. LaA6.9 TaxID=2919914 RepID=UPI001F503B41|nr:flagellar basal body P-ring formation chaperone FlgA [Sphingomonas sp. LaA6.9]MCJ8157708.1 flagellar basal body P-ring formation chaperone FlgA [Sphingomonas sp. LaA6.9]
MRLILSALLFTASGALHAQSAPATVETPVLVRAIEKGEALSPADFAVEPRPASVARGAIAPAETAGLEASRRLMAGAPVRATDLAKPQMVRRGEAVTIALRSGALLITTAGRALSGGGKGDPVRVVSLSTNRTLDAVIENSGRVRVTGQ